MHYILNILGSIIRDISMCLDNDFIDYIYIDKKYIYKSFLPFSFLIGNYIFMTEEDFYKNLNKKQ